MSLYVNFVSFQRVFLMLFDSHLLGHCTRSLREQDALRLELMILRVSQLGAVPARCAAEIAGRGAFRRASRAIESMALHGFQPQKGL